MKKQKLEILLVQYSPPCSNITKYIINKRGHSVFLANGSKTAIEQISKKKFDVILMDIMMPIMDGYDTAIYIRKNIDRVTPIMAMTANATYTKQSCLDAGMNGYVLKPICEKYLEQEFNKVGLIF